jgi:hypothetical protein
VPAVTSVAPEPATIDRAEQQLVEVEDILLCLTERDRCNLGSDFERLAEIAVAPDSRVHAVAASLPRLMGAGNRCVDHMDRDPEDA